MSSYKQETHVGQDVENAFPLYVREYGIDRTEQHHGLPTDSIPRKIKKKIEEDEQ
jgi:hypothetical protein